MASIFSEANNIWQIIYPVIIYILATILFLYLINFQLKDKLKTLVNNKLISKLFYTRNTNNEHIISNISPYILIGFIVFTVTLINSLSNFVSSIKIECIHFSFTNEQLLRSYNDTTDLIELYRFDGLSGENNDSINFNYNTLTYLYDKYYYKTKQAAPERFEAWNTGTTRTYYRFTRYYNLCILLLYTVIFFSAINISILIYNKRLFKNTNRRNAIFTSLYVVIFILFFIHFRISLEVKTQLMFNQVVKYIVTDIKYNDSNYIKNNKCHISHAEYKNLRTILNNDNSETNLSWISPTFFKYRIIRSFYLE